MYAFPSFKEFLDSFAMMRLGLFPACYFLRIMLV
jgi:hypothetical protein